MCFLEVDRSKSSSDFCLARSCVSPHKTHVEALQSVYRRIIALAFTQKNESRERRNYTLCIGGFSAGGNIYLRMCGPALRFLKFTVYDGKIMSIATESCLHIKKLFIANGAEIEENSTLFSESIETFVLKSELQEMKNCLCIKFVNIKSLTVGGVHICDRIFVGILQHASKLQQLTLLCAHGLTEVSCAAIGQYCQSLEQLSVSNIRFSAANLKCILPFTPQLKKLSLLRTTPGYSETKSVLDAVTDSCPLLVELAFYEDSSTPCPAICAAFVRMLTHCVHLRTLSMEFCGFVTDDFLIAIAANAKLMSSLNLCGCDVSNAGVAQIAKHCAELQCIRVSAGKNYMQFETTAECKAFFRSETNVRIQDFDNMTSDEFGMGQYSSDEDDESIALSQLIADSAEEEEDEEDCESNDVDDSSEENYGT